MNNLGYVLQHSCDLSGAAEMHAFTLALRTRVLGAMHPDTLVSMSDMGNVLLEQGGYGEALAVHERTLVLRERVLGE